MIYICKNKPLLNFVVRKRDREIEPKAISPYAAKRYRENNTELTNEQKRFLCVLGVVLMREQAVD